MLWNDFLNKIKEAKKNGIPTGLQVPSIITLIYMGAFDSTLDGVEPSLPLYKKMVEEVKKATGSKAKTPTKKKGEYISIDDIDGDMSLALWRQSLNPFFETDMFKGCQQFLSSNGFTFMDGYPVFPYVKKNERGETTHALTANFDILFDPNVKARILRKESPVNVGVIGIVTESKVLPYGDGSKERLVFKMFTGKETTGEIVVWPDKDTGKISVADRNNIDVMKVLVAFLTPNVYKGRMNAVCRNWLRVLT